MNSPRASTPERLSEVDANFFGGLGVTNLQMSLVTLTLTIGGHLFDTKGFNNVLDMCEKYKVQFRVTNWDIGNNMNSPSQVSL